MHTTPRYSPIPIREAGPIWGRRRFLIANFLVWGWGAAAGVCFVAVIIVGMVHALSVLAR